MINYENEVAVKCGVNAALIADYLWNLKQDHRYRGKSVYRHGKVWVRCSQPMITSEIRYLTVDMVKGAVKELIDKNILRKACFNEDRFDHTNWYTFTEYGEKLVKKGRYKDGKWTREAMVSLGGVAVSKSNNCTLKLPIALQSAIDNMTDLKKNVLHLDRDAAGRAASKEIMAALQDKYEMLDQPPKYGKDYNDYLIMRGTLNDKRLE